MGAVYELDAHQRGLGAENVGIDLIQGLAAQIVIAVAGCPGKAGVRDPVVLKGLHHLAGVVLGHDVDFPKALPELLLGTLCHLVYFGSDL